MCYVHRKMAAAAAAATTVVVGDFKIIGTDAGQLAELALMLAARNACKSFDAPKGVEETKHATPTETATSSTPAPPTAEVKTGEDPKTTTPSKSAPAATTSSGPLPAKATKTRPAWRKEMETALGETSLPSTGDFPALPSGKGQGNVLANIALATTASGLPVVKSAGKTKLTRQQPPQQPSQQPSQQLSQENISTLFELLKSHYVWENEYGQLRLKKTCDCWRSGCCSYKACWYLHEEWLEGKWDFFQTLLQGENFTEDNAKSSSLPQDDLLIELADRAVKPLVGRKADETYDCWIKRLREHNRAASAAEPLPKCFICTKMGCNQQTSHWGVVKGEPCVLVHTTEFAQNVLKQHNVAGVPVVVQHCCRPGGEKCKFTSSHVQCRPEDFLYCLHAQ